LRDGKDWQKTRTTSRKLPPNNRMILHVQNAYRDAPWFIASKVIVKI
jgi:hypothetical protein